MYRLPVDTFTFFLELLHVLSKRVIDLSLPFVTLNTRKLIDDIYMYINTLNWPCDLINYMRYTEINGESTQNV